MRRQLLSRTGPTLALGALTLAWAALTGGDVQARDPLVTRIQAVPPFVTGYDEETDTFQYQNGALTHTPPKIGGPEGYSGNRLTQFRYLGPRKTAGLYRVIDDYVETKKLDPAKYKYRLRW